MKCSAKNLVFVSLFLILGACSSSQAPVQKSNLNYATVKKTIVKGQTTQAEVMKVLGSPNLVTKNKSNDEVWMYTRQSYDAESGAFGGGLLFIGGAKAFSSASSSSFDLILTYDKSEVVQDYSVVVSQY